MADRRKEDVRDESWTEMGSVPPDVLEILPIRRGMVLAGRYAIEKIIGRGGTGVVVRAHDRVLRAAVAIKIVRAELADQRVWTDRLAREVRLARQINHPNVCRVFDFEQADGRAFLVMELADGGTLRDEIRSGSQAARPIAERIGDARTVTWALGAIHRAGIVHRDLSPQNLLRMGDGRLVLSDFGLAVDVSDNTSSVHGGTVAYMAPEVMRGGKATFASDIWGLGVVIHELVFGVKPLWSDGASGQMLAPELGRRLTDEERAVFDTCRACTVRDPARRIARPEEVGVMLAARRRSRRFHLRRQWLAARPPVVVASALTLVAALAVGLSRGRHPAGEVAVSPTPRGPAAPQSPLIVPTGEPTDWTAASTVLAEVPERITCTRLLPDQRTIRFLWGSPPRAEDIDLVTRKRVPSPLVPAAYAEGCPDLSADGQHLVFQGHTPDGRAFAFLSDHPDGRDAVPVVPAAEPSVLSEPTWLADGETFSYELDTTHVGVFSTATRRTNVLTETDIHPFVNMFRFAVGDQVLVERLSNEGEAELVGTTIPDLKESVRFRLPVAGLDFRWFHSKYYYSGRWTHVGNAIVVVDPATLEAHPIGHLPDQSIRHLIFGRKGAVFVSIATGSDLFTEASDGTRARVTVGQHLVAANHCGRNLIVGADEGGRTVTKLIDPQGHTLKTIAPGPLDGPGACSPDGRVAYYSHLGTPATLRRCDELGCRDLVQGPLAGPAVSPDGTKVAFIELDKRGPVVKWIADTGGEVHEVADSETGCAPGWSSNRTLWVSRRRGGVVVWVELDTETGHETGWRRPGGRACPDGRADPDSPVNPDLQIVYDQTSQLRLLDAKFLGPN